jgi:hypothetical protein
MTRLESTKLPAERSLGEPSQLATAAAKQPRKRGGLGRREVERHLEGLVQPGLQPLDPLQGPERIGLIWCFALQLGGCPMCHRQQGYVVSGGVRPKVDREGGTHESVRRRGHRCDRHPARRAHCWGASGMGSCDAQQTGPPDHWGLNLGSGVTSRPGGRPAGRASRLIVRLYPCSLTCRSGLLMTGRRGSQPRWECLPTGSQLGRSSPGPHR